MAGLDEGNIKMWWKGITKRLFGGCKEFKIQAFEANDGFGRKEIHIEVPLRRNYSTIVLNIRDWTKGDDGGIKINNIGECLNGE